MNEQNLFSLYQMGFEPMQLTLAELETASLDHSDTDTGGKLYNFPFQII